MIRHFTRLPVLIALFLPLVPMASSAAGPPSGPSLSALSDTTCRTSWQTCADSVLTLLNKVRASHHVAPLTLSPLQSRGSHGCQGSYGHSWAMARSGQIWHMNKRFPRASFPHNFCVRGVLYGENVGEDAETLTVGEQLARINAVMMSEPHSRSFCAHTDDHACNILDPAFHNVGIGIYLKQGVAWLTEDFAG